MLRSVIIGAGVTGESCARYLQASDVVTVLDTRPNPPGAEALLKAGIDLRVAVAEFDFQSVDRVIVSPGVPLDACLVRQAQACSVPVVSDIDLFLQAANAPVIGVTGTNGKSTVTSMAAALLQQIGINAIAGGNLGDAALDVLNPAAEAYVLELSSFQLERLAGGAMKAAAVLNISDDHLDRHGSFEHYGAAKHRIYRNTSVAICNRADLATPPKAHLPVRTFGLDQPPGPDDWGILRKDGEAWFAQGDRALLPVAALRLSGRHNQVNLLAACALVADFALTRGAIEAVAESFRGLPHRCELVAEHRGVRFINDSKATNVGAAVAAVDGLAGDLPEGNQIVLIAGGEGKGADFAPLAALASKLRRVVLIGRDASIIEQALGGALCVHAEDMRGAVEAAAASALPGDIVLLAPACASFDMFANFEARGDQFAATVRGLGT